MKYNQKLEQLHREGQNRKLIDQLQNNIQKILEGRHESISYQLAYDTVYKLTKQRKQQEILSLIQSKIRQKNSKDFEGLPEKNAGETLLNVLTDINFMAVKISQVCLFLDVNYCQKELNLHLKDKLSQIIFQNICGNDRVLQLIAEEFFEFGLRSHKQDFSPFPLLELIKKLDQKQEFFEKHFLSHYQPLVSKHFKNFASKQWQSLEVTAYLEWAKEQLSTEISFTQKHLVGKRIGKQGLEAIVTCVYEQIVIAYKEQLYKTDQNKLFEQLTLPILELFKFGKSKQLEGHVHWYMTIIEKRLNKIPLQNNIQFLLQFCQLFEHITSLLKVTQNRFEINYRSVFTFEEWINNEKYNLPLRLNMFIQDKICKRKEFEQNFIQKVILIFKLVKEKTLFENLYRRMLLNRLVDRFSIHSIDDELQVIQAMQEECGEQWTKKIKAILTLFVKNRDMMMQGKKKQVWSYGGLLPVVVEEDDWPFQQRQSKIILHQQLRDLTPIFEEKYIPQTKNHKLFWSPYLGSVLLNIRFEGHQRQIVVSIDAANLLLYLQIGKKKLTNYLCQTGYKIDQIQHSVQNLISAKLIKSVSQGSDFILELADSFEAGGRLDLSQKDSKIEVKAMQQLKADRKLMVEAIIVKIMKSEKVAKRDQLVEKTAPYLAQRGFNFNVDFVQKSIDRLLDKEFLRDFQDGNLGYIA